MRTEVDLYGVFDFEAEEAGGFVHVDGDFEELGGVEAAEYLADADVVEMFGELRDGRVAFEEQLERAPAADLVEQGAVDVEGDVVELIDIDDGATDVVGAGDGPEGDAFYPALYHGAQSTGGEVLGQVPDGFGEDVRQREAAGWEVGCVDAEDGRWGDVENEGEDAVVGANEMVAEVRKRQERPRWLVEVVDADEVYRTGGKSLPSVFEQERGLDNIIVGHIVADVHGQAVGRLL